MGYVYTILQFILIGTFLFVPPFIPFSLVANGVLIFAVLLGVWSVWVFRYTTINVFPYLPSGAHMITMGPYRIIRHPMYLAVLLFSMAYFIDQPTIIYGLLFFAMLLVLLLKIRFEERLLSNSFEEYEEHFYKTYRLIPCVY